MAEKLEKNPAEMSDEEFLEYMERIASLPDEDEVIDEGAEGEPDEVGDEAVDVAGELLEESEGADVDSEASSGNAEPEKSGEITADAESVASEEESGSVASDTAQGGIADGEPADAGVEGALKSGAEPGGGADTVMNDWLMQEKALRRVIPTFNLKQAFENPQFKQFVVDEGMDIIDAYEKLNPEKAKEAAVLDEIGRGAVSGNGTAKHDVDSMSDEEFRRYIKRIEEEE